MNTEALLKLRELKKPSELFRLALTDLRAIENTPGCVVDMYVWIEDRSNGCHMCLAGSVMHQRLNMTEADWNNLVEPRFYTSEAHSIDHLSDAINQFREGRIEDAIESFYWLIDGSHIPDHPFTNKEPVEPYEQNLVDFYASTEKLIQRLEAAGL